MSGAGEKKYPEVDAFESAIRAETFERTMRSGKHGTMGMDITATFTGRFVWRPPTQRRLELEGVSNLRIVPAKLSPDKNTPEKK